MSVEYTKEQAEQVIIDQNEFCGRRHLGGHYNAC